MAFLNISISVLSTVVFLSLIISLICFFKVFYSVRKEEKEEFPIPKGRIYEEYRPQMVEWLKSVRCMEHLDVSIKSHDGLTLRGRYYEYEKGAPIEILFHGYRGTSERDLSGAVHRCFHLKRSALIVDHRASGRSEGHVITFGAKEAIDCTRWVDFVINNIDSKAKIIITGISMGASTVMIAASKDLPSNVVGVLADCGYTSAEEIIKKVMVDQKLPPKLLYPFVRLGALLFGGFDPKDASPLDSMKKCRLPVIFFHGDDDRFVPCDMSERNYAACAADQKRLVITKGAGHGLCFISDMDGYYKEVEEFFGPILEVE